MDAFEQRISRLKSHFPAADRSTLEYAITFPTQQDALNYLSSIYGNPASKPSAWAKPLAMTAPQQEAARNQARNRALGTKEMDLGFEVDNYKVKECRDKAGCTCDGYHHEYERRRNTNRYKYSEIPCSAVYKGSWVAPGLCPRGDSCTHSHTVNEASYHPRSYKTRPCVKYDNGVCHYGIKCAFIHGSNDPMEEAWRRYQQQKEARQREEELKRQTKDKVTIHFSSLLPKNMQATPKPETPFSQLSASAWTFVPQERNLSPMEQINLKMQKRIEELYLKTLCSICFQREKNTALVPCGHVFCEECTTSFMTADCPVCRRSYGDKLSIFL